MKQKLLFNSFTVFLTSIIAHLVLVAIGLSGVGQPMGDITFAYEPWLRQMQLSHSLLGLNQSWVYPFVALPAIFVPAAFAAAFNLSFQSAWLAFSILIDLVALGFLLGWRTNPARARTLAAYLWIALQFLLGPVSISRLDNLSIALCVIAVAALIDGRESLAGVWLTAATWLKVWPAAIVVGLLAGAKRFKVQAVAVSSTALGFLLIGWLLGGHQVLSFITHQSNRGIQIEAPVAGFWLWQSVIDKSAAGINYDSQYLTFQVWGQNTQLISSLMGLAMAVALAITVTLAFLARKRISQAPANATPRLLQELFSVATLTAVLDLIVFNKVGSPQYQGWLFVPALAAVAFGLKKWRSVLSLIVLLQPTTWLIYPVFYDHLLAGQPFAIALLTFRNLILICLLVIANQKLTRMALARY